MAITYTTTSKASLENGIKALVFGKAGHGKTALCASAPRPIIISAESGLLSMKKENLERIFGVGTPGITYDVPVAEIANIDDVNSLYLWATTSPEADNFDTICLDSLTEIAEKCLNAQKKAFKDPRQAYGALIEKMTDLIRAFRDIKGKHVYFSAKQEWNKDDVTGITSYGPSMPGNKLGQALPYFFDEVFCLNVGKTADQTPFRFLQTQPDFQFNCKDRSGCLDVMEQPNLGIIFQKMLHLQSVSA